MDAWRSCLQRRQSADACRCQRHCRRHEGMGAGAGRDALYPLVPAHDRLHRREARQLHLALPVSGTICHGVFRQGAGDAASRMPRRSRRAACARRSRQAATPPGTPPPTPSSRTVALYIPTVFCSYSGEALDKKTPLLRSIERGQPSGGADSSPVRRHKDAEGHRRTSDPKQEYFLIDKELYLKREDLRMCGRTLFGAKPPKGQELDDHYYGSIRPRVDRLYAATSTRSCGSSACYSKTKHNEVAPSAARNGARCTATCNTACDQNQLTMEIMKKVADRHGLVCLLHEKPFAGVNGSGKHDNWSLATDTGKNLFAPGKTPSQNGAVSAVPDRLHRRRRRLSGASALHRCFRGQRSPSRRAGGASCRHLHLSSADELEAMSSTPSSTRPTIPTARRARCASASTCCRPFRRTRPTATARRRVAFTGNKFEFRMPRLQPVHFRVRTSSLNTHHGRGA